MARKADKYASSHLLLANTTEYEREKGWLRINGIESGISGHNPDTYVRVVYRQEFSKIDEFTAIHWWDFIADTESKDIEKNMG